jgi:HEAT repeat protein
MLNHDEWYVVRNMAELAGELGMEEAVPALARQLAHPDERVRKATALSLAKIGTSGAAEALRRALRDKSADVRMQVALGVGGRRSIGLVLALVAALDEEKDEAVQRELILALGRIGTPDAVQALIKVSQAPRRLFGRRPTALRIAAIEALRLAGTAPAIGTLEGLAEGSDRQVSAAAKAALEDAKRPPKR